MITDDKALILFDLITLVMFIMVGVVFYLLRMPYWWAMPFLYYVFAGGVIWLVVGGSWRMLFLWWPALLFDKPEWVV